MLMEADERRIDMTAAVVISELDRADTAMAEALAAQERVGQAACAYVLARYGVHCGYDVGGPEAQVRSVELSISRDRSLREKRLTWDEVHELLRFFNPKKGDAADGEQLPVRCVGVYLSGSLVGGDRWDDE